MNLVDEKISSYLSDEIHRALNMDESKLSKLFVKNKEIIIDGKKFKKDCWIEDIAEGRLFSIEISRKKLFFKKVYAMGMLMTNIGRKVIDQDGMWDLGFG